jgi:hypothetical protein
VLRHVALHAKLEHSHAVGTTDVKRELREAGFDKRLVQANLKNLEKLVSGLEPAGGPTEWSDYGVTCSYSDEDTRAKEDFVRAVVLLRPRSLIWDLGCNDGRYSRIAAGGAKYTIALDADRGVVNRLYLALKDDDTRTILPLVGDIADPSPGLGWRGKERRTLLERGQPDFVLALALIHHLSIGRMIPLRAIVDWFAELDSEVLVEFPHREDPMVTRLLHRKHEDAHPDYSRDTFEELLRRRFAIVRSVELPSGCRTMYHIAPA